MSTNTSSQHIFQILRLVAESAEPRGVADIARDTGLPTTTVYRALLTLAEARYLSRDEGTARYRIGQMPLILLKALFNRFPILQMARPSLKLLAQETGETVSLSLRIGWYGVRIASMPGSNDSTYKPLVGYRQLLHRRSAQSLVLAGLPDEDIQAYRRFIKRHYPEFTAEVEKSSFLKELRAVKNRGYATTLAPLGNGYHFAMPLRDARNVPLGIIHILGPVVDVAEPVPDARILRWFALRDACEKELHAHPGKYEGPFAHIHPDEIHLRVST